MIAPAFRNLLITDASFVGIHFSNNRELLSDPHLNERGFFVDMAEPRFGVKRYDGQSILGNFVDKSHWKTTRDVGESSKEILVELLGYTNADCKNLEKEETVLFQ